MVEQAPFLVELLPLVSELRLQQKEALANRKKKKEEEEEKKKQEEEKKKQSKTTNEKHNRSFLRNIFLAPWAVGGLASGVHWSLLEIKLQ